MKEYQQIIDRLDAENNLRSIPQPFPEGVINLSSNDYLGLLNDNALWQEFLSSYNITTSMMSSCSSRLLTGNSYWHNALEELLAGLYQKESALIFNSGYHANIGILPALTGSDDLIVADKLVHASIIDGIRLSEAKLLRFRHNDLNHLEDLLVKHRAEHDRVFIVTESIFSMDGDIAPLKELVDLKERFDAFLYIDEAHAVGVRGSNGLGVLEELNLTNDADIIVGTFGKAIASMGAYVVCNQLIRKMLVNRCRPLIFSTAIPAINCAWSHFILSKHDSFAGRRSNLTALQKQLRDITGSKSESHIIPFVTGSNESAVALSNHLKKHNYHVLPIRHPTVLKGEARVRFSLTAGITPEQLSPLKQLLNDFKMD